MATPPSDCSHVQRKQRLQAHGLHVKPAPEHHSTLRRASILILLANDGNILLTQRTLQLRSHPGDVCFPGGKQDETDQDDDWVTALRETKEEVGLTIDPERLARLRTLESMHHLCVTPLVAFWDKTSTEISSRIQINPTEVEQFFWVPLEFFLTTRPVQEYEIPWQGEIFVFRKYLFGSHQIPITGLTAHVAQEVATIAFSAATTNLINNTMVQNCQEYQGLLWRRQDPTNEQKTPTWSQRYFILTKSSSNCSSMLHQYDNRQMAERKSQSALKKNRLKLDDSIHVQDMEDEDNNVHAFSISILQGRIVWYLASSSPQERSHWKRWLLECTNNVNKTL